MTDTEPRKEEIRAYNLLDLQRNLRTGFVAGVLASAITFIVIETIIHLGRL